MVSKRTFGLASLTSDTHRVKIKATVIALNRQGLRSWIPKPSQPHWFVNSSKVFSLSA